MSEVSNLEKIDFFVNNAKFRICVWDKGLQESVIEDITINDYWEVYKNGVPFSEVWDKELYKRHSGR